MAREKPPQPLHFALAAESPRAPMLPYQQEAKARYDAMIAETVLPTQWAAHWAARGAIALADGKGNNPAWASNTQENRNDPEYVRTLEQAIIADPVLHRQALEAYTNRTRLYSASDNRAKPTSPADEPPAGHVYRLSHVEEIVEKRRLEEEARNSKSR